MTAAPANIQKLAFACLQAHHQRAETDWNVTEITCEEVFLRTPADRSRVCTSKENGGKGVYMDQEQRTGGTRMSREQRKRLKQRARRSVKLHYGVMLSVCLLAILLGTEFTGSLDFLKVQTPTDIKVEREVLEESEFGIEQNNVWKVVTEVLAGNVEQGTQDADRLTQEAIQKNQASGERVLGRTNGVLANLVNDLTSGLFFVKFVKGFYRLGFSQGAILFIVSVLVLSVGVGFWFLVKNVYRAAGRRVFLECRTYEKVSLQRLLFFLRSRRWVNACVNMLMQYVLYILWSLTVVGAAVKRYSYFMVPFIVAENPEISWRDSITLSRRMMDGHKWECFLLELTFVPWKILGIATLGLTDFFYINAYKTATFAEYYAHLRALAKKANLAGSVLLNDTYLFERAERSVLAAAYADMMLQGVGAVSVPLTGVRGFMERNFGVVMYSRAEEMKIWEAERHQLAEEEMEEILNRHAYPDRLSPNPIHRRSNHFEKLHYMRHYTISSLVLMFFIFSFVGWLWEVNLHLLSSGRFVNRGILQGPWLPIYGSGCVMILLLLYRLRRKPLKEFAATVVLCGIVEYFTSYFMEMIYHTRWWDYSGYFLNLNGRICAEGLFVFGVGGFAVVYLAAPAIDNWLRRLKPKLCVTLCAVLLMLFACDEVYSSAHPNQGAGISTSATTMQKAGDAQDTDSMQAAAVPGIEDTQAAGDAPSAAAD